MANQHVPEVIGIDDKGGEDMPMEKYDYPIDKTTHLLHGNSMRTMVPFKISIKGYQGN